jgi:signal peptidase I
VIAWSAGGAVGALVLAALAGAVWARRTLLLVTVRGSSMAPTFEDGDRLLVTRRTVAQLRAGDVAVLHPPGWGRDARGGLDGGRSFEPPGRAAWNVKRVLALPGDPTPDTVRLAAGGAATVPPGAIAVAGDNRRFSSDSRQHGFYPGEGLLGVVACRLVRAQSGR